MGQDKVWSLFQCNAKPPEGSSQAWVTPGKPCPFFLLLPSVATFTQSFPCGSPCRASRGGGKFLPDGMLSQPTKAPPTSFLLKSPRCDSSTTIRPGSDRSAEASPVSTLLLPQVANPSVSYFKSSSKTPLQLTWPCPSLLAPRV